MTETKQKNFGSIYDLPLQNASALAPNIEKRTVYGPGDRFWEGWVMRHFILPARESIPEHSHEWDHLMYTISGDGYVEVEGERFEMKRGYWTRVPGGTNHVYRNEADIPLEFFCIVPFHGDPQAKKTVMRAERAARKAEDSED